MGPLRARISFRREDGFWKGNGNHSEPYETAKERLTGRILQTPDYGLLQTLYDAWVMDTASVARYHYRWRVDGSQPNRDPMHMARYCLCNLWRAGLLVRGRPQAAQTGGSVPFFYRISRLGYEVLKREHWDPRLVGEIDRGYADSKASPDRILHHAEVSDFITRWLVELEQRVDPQWVFWTPVGAATCEIGSGAQAVRLSPDGIVQVGPPKSCAVYFVEWERSADGGHFRDKLRRMNDFRLAVGWQRARHAYGVSLFGPPRYLVVAWEEADPKLRRLRSDRGTLEALLGIARDHEEGEYVLFLRGEDWEQGRWKATSIRGDEWDLLA